MPKPAKYKRPQEQWTHDAQVKNLGAKLGQKMGRDTKPSPPPGCGNKAEIALHLEKALELPAAHLPILKAASVDKMAEKIRLNMDAEVDVKELLAEFPGMDPAQVIEIAKLYTDRQARALEIGKGLVSALIKAQTKKGPGSQVNVQINTGDVDMGTGPVKS